METNLNAVIDDNGVLRLYPQFSFNDWYLEHTPGEESNWELRVPATTGPDALLGSWDTVEAAHASTLEMLGDL